MARSVNVLLELFNFVVAAAQFASLAQGELLALLDMLENQFIFFFTVALHGQ